VDGGDARLADVAVRERRVQGPQLVIAGLAVAGVAAGLRKVDRRMEEADRAGVVPEAEVGEFLFGFRAFLGFLGVNPFDNFWYKLCNFVFYNWLGLKSHIEVRTDLRSKIFAFPEQILAVLGGDSAEFAEVDHESDGIDNKLKVERELGRDIAVEKRAISTFAEAGQKLTGEARDNI
jgi:hypothetical protein